MTPHPAKYQMDLDVSFKMVFGVPGLSAYVDQISPLTASVKRETLDKLILSRFI